MSLEYEQNTHDFEAVASLLDDYVDWFGQIASAVAYPNQTNVEDSVVKPQGFLDWVNKSREEVSVSEDVLENLVDIHADLLANSETVIQIVSGGEKPDHGTFSDFKNLFDAFVSRMRRLEKDSLADGAGLDEKTGLRNQKVLNDDLKKEMERVGRRGSPFSMILTRIDDYFKYDDKDSVIQLVANNIKKCMRTFDDAYYMDKGTFLLSLKQADMIGAQAATTRLQDYIKTDIDNKDETTLSYCMTEPVPGDDVEALVANMMADLDAYEGEEDVVLKFVEVSPLQRYMDSLEE